MLAYERWALKSTRPQGEVLIVTKTVFSPDRPPTLLNGASGDTPSPNLRFRVACHPKTAGRRVVGPEGLEPPTTPL